MTEIAKYKNDNNSQIWYGTRKFKNTANPCRRGVLRGKSPQGMGRERSGDLPDASWKNLRPRIYPAISFISFWSKRVVPSTFVHREEYLENRTTGVGSHLLLSVQPYPKLQQRGSQRGVHGAALWRGVHRRARRKAAWGHTTRLGVDSSLARCKWCARAHLWTRLELQELA